MRLLCAFACLSLVCCQSASSLSFPTVSPDTEAETTGTTAGPPPFSLNAPLALAVRAGEVVDYTVAIARAATFSGEVILTISGLPTQVTTSPDVRAVLGDAATFDLHAAIDAPVGALHKVTIHAAGGGFETDATFTLSVAETEGFSLSVTQHVQLPAQNKISVTVLRAPGFVLPVSVSFRDLPSKLHASPVTLDAAAQHVDIAITSDDVTVEEFGMFDVIAEAGGIVREASVSYNHLPPPGFTMSVPQATLNIARTTQATVEVGLVRMGQWAGSITITADALPSGVTMTPISQVISGALDRATITLSADAGANITMTDLVIHGTATNVESQQAILHLNVVDVPSFVLSTASTLQVRQSDTANLDLSVTRNNGFEESLFSELMTPSQGVSASGGMFSGTGSTATLSVSAAPDALLLVPTLSTVRVAPSGGIARSSPLTVTVLPAADPQLDSSFALGGARLLNAQPSNVSKIYASRVLSNGQIVGLQPTSLVRLNADGSDLSESEIVLPTFASAGEISADGSAHALSLFGTSVSVAHLLSDGSADANFGTGGAVTFNFGQAEGLRVRSSDGKVYVFGQSAGDFAIARLTTGGALDPSFGSGGMKLVDFGGNDFAMGAAIGASGDITVVGYSVAAAGASSYALCRLTNTGALDGSFDGDGRVTHAFGLSQQVDVVLPLGSAGILVGGYANTDGMSPQYRVSRLTAAGDMDVGFGSNGRFDLLPGNQFNARGAMLDGAGRAVVFGGGSSGLMFFRLTTAGGLDTSFSGDGIDALRGGTQGFEYASSLSVDAAGHYLLFGYFGARTVLARYQP